MAGLARVVMAMMQASKKCRLRQRLLEGALVQAAQARVEVQSGPQQGQHYGAFRAVQCSAARRWSRRAAFNAPTCNTLPTAARLSMLHRFRIVLCSTARRASSRAAVPPTLGVALGLQPSPPACTPKCRIKMSPSCLSVGTANAVPIPFPSLLQCLLCGPVSQQVPFLCPVCLVGLQPWCPPHSHLYASQLYAVSFLSLAATVAPASFPSLCCPVSSLCRPISRPSRIIDDNASSVAWN